MSRDLRASAHPSGLQQFSRKISLAVDQCENLNSIREYFIDKTV